MTTGPLVEVPARRGKAVGLGGGRSLEVINTAGTQVVDTWAFSADDLHEFMSMEPTRATLRRFVSRAGDPLLGVRGEPDNCTDDLRAALAELGLAAPAVPCPLNLWMNIPVARDGALDFRPTVAKPGDVVAFCAEVDLIVVFSACPQDLVPINDHRPSAVHVRLL